jgi:DNA-binding transcriptional LysR family regulator
MFEISQLRCFVTLAEELHFGRAAERLNMTQPPLSRQIRLLEHHVGTQLLERDSRNVKLTAAGRVFLPEAARILRLAQEASTTARRVAKGEQGALSIGFTATIGYERLPEMVRTLRQKIPAISLTLKELVTHAQLEALDSGQIDLGLMRPHIQHSELDTMAMTNEGLLLAIPEREQKRWPERPTLHALHEQAFLMYSPYEANYFYQLVQSQFERLNIQPEVIEYVAQIHTMLALVSSGLGVALIPESAARLQFKGIVTRRISMTPAKPVAMVASWRKDNHNPMLQVFKDSVLPAHLLKIRSRN